MCCDECMCAVMSACGLCECMCAVCAVCAV